jgi:hypothetical protein
VGADNKVPGTSDSVARKAAGRQTPIKDGHLAVSELISDRPAAPSPFGDDQSFPLPVERLTYTHTVTP